MKWWIYQYNWKIIDIVNVMIAQVLTPPYPPRYDDLKQHFIILLIPCLCKVTHTHTLASLPLATTTVRSSLLTP